MSNDNVYKNCQTTFVHHIAVFDVRKDPWLQCLSFYSYAQACLYVAQWRLRRSGWSGLGRTTFQRVVGPVLRLLGHSDNWARCPTQARLCPLCTNRSRFFPGGAGGALRGPRISILQVVLTAACCSLPPSFTCTSDRLFAVA